MPNTLAHFAAQGLLSHRIVRAADPRWILLGCILPDVPWMLQRAIKLFAPQADLYAVRFYAIAQASLFTTLFLCAAIALLAYQPWRVWFLLSLNAVLHLLLDAAQTKWGNGVHLWAPYSWDLLNFGWFWPESWPTYLLTGAGLLYLGWSSRQSQGPLLATPRMGRLIGSGLMLSLYLLLPLWLMSGPAAADNHYMATLRDRDSRAESYVEMDRVRTRTRDGKAELRTPAREWLAVTPLPPVEDGVISVRGRFTDQDTVQLTEVHTHRAWLRNFTTYIGLLGAALILLRPRRQHQN